MGDIVEHDPDEVEAVAKALYQADDVHNDWPAWREVCDSVADKYGRRAEAVLSCSAILSLRQQIESARVEGLREAKFFADESVRFFAAAVRDHKGDYAAEELLKASLRSAKDNQWAIDQKIEVAIRARNGSSPSPEK